MCVKKCINIIGKETLAYEPWPQYDEAKLVVDEVEIVVQVNGKLRGRVNVTLNSTEEEVKELALQIPTVMAQTEGKMIRKNLCSNKLINIVYNQKNVKIFT